MNNSAAGYDGLPSSIMKQCVKTYVQLLNFLIYIISIIQGTFPSEHYQIIPLYKGEDIQSIKNYRPISVLPYFSKIFAKVMFTQITIFLKEITLCMNINLGFEQNNATKVM